MADIPIILCFDDRILMGAGVTILSLLDAAADTTSYHIHILHPGLDAPIQTALQSLVADSRHTMAFHEIPPSRFADAPKNRGSWNEIVYYRLIASEVLTDIDKAIYSDVDVFVTGDLAAVWAEDLTGHDWAGVAAEANRPDNVGHRHFPENPKDTIYFSGFMVMNLHQMRQTNAVARYYETIRAFHDRLKFFDLDVLNLASDQIKRLPFAYVTLEDIYEADDVTLSKDYEYLKSVYSVDELEAARDAPVIIHYAGRRGKPWQRMVMPPYYVDVVQRLPRALRRGTFRDFRKRWFSAKGRRAYPTRS